jgi:hypothetical protein
MVTPIRTAALFASTYLVPAIGFPVVSYLWWRATGSWAFATAVMGIPVVFGYVMPWVATSLVKRWRFTGGPRVGSYYVHHGFIYASKLALALLLVVRSIDDIQSAAAAGAVIAVTGAATGFGGWWHDAQAVRAGRIEVAGGLESLGTFAPPSYFSMGATYAAVALGAHRLLADEPAALLWVFPAGVLVLCVVPTLVFLAVDPPTRIYFATGRASMTRR